MKLSRSVIQNPTCCLVFAAIALILSSAGSVCVAASYSIESLFSDEGGWFQYIQLRENSEDGRVTSLAGSIITVTHGGIVKRYTIASDPPPAFPAGGTLIISTITDWSSDDSASAPALPPDYVMPVRFLPTDGGTIDLDGQNPWTFGALP